MTLGEYPDKVPPRVPDPARRRSARSCDVGRFENVAPLVGLVVAGAEPGRRQHLRRLHRRRPARPLHDLARRRPRRLAVRQPRRRHVRGPLGRGRPRRPGLCPERHPRRLSTTTATSTSCCSAAAGRSPLRLSLLRNKGDGAFEDVTVASGLGEPIATESAAWGDYDNDGWLDLFVCGEYRLARSGEPTSSSPTRATAAGSITTRATARSSTSPRRPASPNERWAKGSAWGDYDDDGRLDLFVSNMDRPCRLYHNEGDGTFRDVAPELGVAGPPHGFACWFWDYDNDGRLDLFVNDYSSNLAEVVADYLGLPVEVRRPPPPLPQPRRRRVPRRQPRSRARPADARWAATSATSTTTASSTSTSAPAGCPTRAWSPT